MNTVNIRMLGASRIESNVWYPFASPNTYKRLSVVRAEGIMLSCTDGKQYYDAVSGLWNTPLGYGVQSINEAVERQLCELQYCSLFEHSTPVAEEAAAILLNSCAESMDKVVWSCTGSESIECAIKIMRAYQKARGNIGRTVILSFSESYHGTHYGAVSISGLEQEAAQEISPVLPGVGYLAAAYEYDTDEEKARKIGRFADIIEESRDRIAGVFIEPVLASAGVKAVDRGYLKAICAYCRENDILVAFDEVTTGFYRAGTRYYYQSLGVSPDILCLSKAINNGVLPLAATVVSRDICDCFKNNAFVLQHGTTQGGNPLALAAFIAADREFELLAQSEELPAKAEEFFNILGSAVLRHGYVETLRHKGFMYSVVMRRERCTVAADITGVVSKIRSMGVLVYPAETGFTLMPCLCTDLAQWRTIVDIIDSAMDRFV